MFVVAVATAIVLMSTLVTTGNCSAFYFGNSTRKLPIYSVETGNQKKQIALTFDAAWGADKTEKIVKILREHNAGATFFLVGFWVDKFKDETKMISDNGFEIGNHSKNHTNMSNLSPDAIEREIVGVSDEIFNITGQKPKYFRAPFGDYNTKLVGEVENLGLQCIQWSIDSLDWKGLGGKDIADRVLGRAKNGDIVLFHNNSEHILDALPIILLGLENQGFEMVGLSKMVASDNFYIDNNGKQIKK